MQHQSPSYLASLIIPHLPSRALCSQGQQLLAKPHVKTTIGSRALRVAAPAIWNSLPPRVRQSPSFDSFKRNLKTYIYTSHDYLPASDSNNCSSKTELIWFYSGRWQLGFVENDIELSGNHIAPVHTVRDLGVMLDSNMTISQHVLRVCQNCYIFPNSVDPSIREGLVCWIKTSLGACLGP